MLPAGGIAMTLSEVFYEAACKISHGEWVGTGPAVLSTGGFDAHAEYCALMRPDTLNTFADEVDKAASEIDWTSHDFRTFMLLMASEAVK